MIVDTEARRSLTTHVLATTGGRRARECNLPRAVAAHPREPRIYVACAGLDELLELDARSSDPMRTVLRRFPVPGGPTGVAVAAREQVAVVFGQFDEELAGGAARRSPRPVHPPRRGHVHAEPRGAPRAIALLPLRRSAHHPRRDGVLELPPRRHRGCPHLADTRRPAPDHHARRPRLRHRPLRVDPQPGQARRLHHRHLPSARGQRARQVRSRGPRVLRHRAPAPRPARARRTPIASSRAGGVFFGRGCAGCHLGGSGTDARRHLLESLGQGADRHPLAPATSAGRAPTSTTGATRPSTPCSATGTAAWARRPRSPRPSARPCAPSWSRCEARARRLGAGARRGLLVLVTELLPELDAGERSPPLVRGAHGAEDAEGLPFRLLLAPRPRVRPAHRRSRSTSLSFLPARAGPSSA